MAVTVTTNYVTGVDQLYLTSPSLQKERSSLSRLLLHAGIPVLVLFGLSAGRESVPTYEIELLLPATGTIAFLPLTLSVRVHRLGK